LATLLTLGLTPPGAESCVSEDAGRPDDLLLTEPGPSGLPVLDWFDI
jgi:hypothetical protein